VSYQEEASALADRLLLLMSGDAVLAKTARSTLEQAIAALSRSQDVARVTDHAPGMIASPKTIETVSSALKDVREHANERVFERMNFAVNRLLDELGQARAAAPQPPQAGAIPVERPVDPDDIDAVTEAIQRETGCDWEIAARAAVAAIDTLIERGNHSPQPQAGEDRARQLETLIDTTHEADPRIVEWRAELDGMRRAAPAAPAVAPHDNTDNIAVDSFARAMKAKVAKSRAKGRSGWEGCDPADLSRMLREHVEKGDPIDVANFGMMLYHHGAKIAAPAPAEPKSSCDPADICAGCRCKFSTYGDAAPAEPKGEQQAGEPCNACHGSGWVTRDPDIGTDQECCVCDGTGTVEPEQRAATLSTCEVPTRVVYLLALVKKDGVLKRSSELQEVFRLLSTLNGGKA